MTINELGIATLAQLAEQGFCKPQVVVESTGGSINLVSSNG